MKSTNVRWQPSKVSLEQVEQRNGHKGCIVWFTGLSASGKSSISIEVEKILFEAGYNAFILDGDNIRHGLNKDLGFSPEDREENIRRISEVSKLFRSGGFIVLTAFISPYIKDRDYGRSIVEPGRFCEVFVKCSIEGCMKRDPKGLYQKAIEGKIPEFTGISAPYEPPEEPELVIDTEKYDIQQSAELVIEKLREMKIIK